MAHNHIKRNLVDVGDYVVLAEVGKFGDSKKVVAGEVKLIR